jgi:hypothetical protein
VGRRSEIDNARAIYDHLVQREVPPGLPDESAVAEINRIVAAADKAILD